MAEPLRLVQSDTGPQVKVTLTRSDTGSAIDLTGATSCQLHFRKKGGTTVLFSMNNISSATDQGNGVAIFAFTGTQLNLAAGNYEGEVEVVFSSGVRETVFEIFEFVLREDFA